MSGVDLKTEYTGLEEQLREILGVIFNLAKMDVIS